MHTYRVIAAAVLSSLAVGGVAGTACTGKAADPAFGEVTTCTATECQVDCLPRFYLTKMDGFTKIASLKCENGKWAKGWCMRDDNCNVTKAAIQGNFVDCECIHDPPVKNGKAQWFDFDGKVGGGFSHCITGCSKGKITGQQCRYRRVVEPQIPFNASFPECGKLQECRACTGGDRTTCPTVCNTMECKNGGDCYENKGEAFCKCTPDFYGTNCELKHPCTVNPCKNGGGCTERNGKAFCVCSPKFGGEFCEVKQSTACQAGTNPCKAGTCEVKFGKTTCDCPAGKYGAVCDKTTQNPAPSNKCKPAGLPQCLLNTNNGKGKIATCDRYNQMAKCATDRSCSSFLKMMCDNFFTKVPACKPAVCSSAGTTCDSKTAGLCTDDVQRQKGKSYCDIQKSLLKCARYSTCDYLFSSICTKSNILKCNLDCPTGYAAEYDDGDRNIDYSENPDAEGAAAWLGPVGEGSPRGHMGLAAPVVALLAVVAVAILIAIIRRRSTAGEEAQAQEASSYQKL